MRKLLRAAYVRIRMMKSFWFGLAAAAAYGLMAVCSNYSNIIVSSISPAQAFAQVFFQHTAVMGIVSAVFTSLFTGTEYSDGTIRNKLMVGRSRKDIYLSNYISCAAAGIVHAAAASAIVWLCGFILMGKPQIEPVQTAWSCVVILFFCMAYASVFNLTAMLISSKSYASIVNVLLAFAFLIAAMTLYSRLCEPPMWEEYTMAAEGGSLAVQTVPNPHYVTGLKRDIYQFFLDFLPSGQMMQVMSPMEKALNPAVACAYSVVIIVVSNVAGILGFGRKDIK